jgi:hypothetical protein
MAYTLADYAKTVTDPHKRGVIETLYKWEPVMGLIPFESIAGLSYSYNQEASLPGVNFRNINEAYAVTAGVVNRLVETFKPFGGESDTDRVLVNAYGQTQRSTRDAAFTKSMAIKYVQTMLYGNNGARSAGAFDDIKGFDGIEARITAAQTVDALGTGASTGSSVFVLRFGEDGCMGLQTPEGVDVKDLGEISSAPVYRTRIEHVAGFGIFDGTSVAWIKDIAPASQVLTTTLLDQAIDLIAGTPSCILMTKRSRRQLKTSALTAGVALSMSIDQLGNYVERWGGIPIYVSDAMIDTEVMP